MVFAFEPAIVVPPDATDDDLERLRVELTDGSAARWIRRAPRAADAPPRTVRPRVGRGPSR
jgi:hypothetical protein